MRRSVKIIRSVLFVLSALCLFCVAGNSLGITNLNHKLKIITGVAAVVSGFFAARFLAAEKNNADDKRKIMHFAICCIFVFYVAALIDFTLIDDGMGRNIFNVYSWSREAFADYIETKTNFVPFATVGLFLSAGKSGALPISAVAENLIGNLIAFMPLPFFFSGLFAFFKKRHRVIIAVFISPILIEVLQLLFLTGSCDIDDVILNVAGELAVFFILRNSNIRKFINNFTFGGVCLQ